MKRVISAIGAAVLNGMEYLDDKVEFSSSNGVGMPIATWSL